MSNETVILIVVVILVLLWMFSSNKEGFSSQEESNIRQTIDIMGDNSVNEKNTCNGRNVDLGQPLESQSLFYAANGELVNGYLQT